MSAKSALRQSRKPRKSPHRPTKRSGRGASPTRPVPASAEYDDEVTEDELRQLRDAVREDVEAEELEMIDGPGW